MRNLGLLAAVLAALALVLSGCKGEEKKKEAPKQKKEEPAPKAVEETPPPAEADKEEAAEPAEPAKEAEAPKGEEPPPVAAEEKPAAEEDPELTQTIVARVNGKDIDAADYVERLKKLTKGKVTQSMIKKTVVDRMINDELLRQEIERLGITVSDEETAEAMNMDMERFNKQKDAMGARINAFEERVAVRKVLEARSLLVTPTDDELKKEYERRFGLKIDAVTFPLAAEATADDVAKADAEANAVLAAAKSGLTLREAVKDPKDATGRRLLVKPMFIKKGDERHIDMYTAAESLQEKDFAGPIKSAQGLVVFQLAKRIEPRQSFDEMKDKLAKSALNMKTAQAKHQLLEELRKNAKLEYLIEFKPTPQIPALRDLRGGARLAPGINAGTRDILRGGVEMRGAAAPVPAEGAAAPVPAEGAAAPVPAKGAAAPVPAEGAAAPVPAEGAAAPVPAEGAAAPAAQPIQ